MKYYLIAGERSGDLHGSNLIKELKIEDSNASFRFMGGELMQKEGGHLVENYSKISFMGFFEVITHLPDVLKTLKKIKNDILQNKPDVVILIDFAGFNMRIAKFCKEHHIKVFYYISPKIWAWNTKRVHKIIKYVDKMFCILPFEKEFYKKYNYKVDYVGNPIFDAINKFVPNPDFFKINKLEDKPIIAVLPGSRIGEIENMLIYMLSIIPSFPEHQFVVAGVSSLPKEFYDNFEHRNNIKIIYEQTYDLLSRAEVAVVTSGTATLETALFNVPQVVCYKTSLLSYLIGRAVIKVPYISLVNLIGEKKIVSELIQEEYNPKILLEHIKYINSIEGKAQIQKDYIQLKEKLTTEFSASKTTAKFIVNYLK